MAVDVQALETELARNDTVDGSAELLITRLLADVEASKSDPAAVQSVVDRWRARTDQLAAAVQAGTPADPSAPQGASRK